MTRRIIIDSKLPGEFTTVSKSEFINKHRKERKAFDFAKHHERVEKELNIMEQRKWAGPMKIGGCIYEGEIDVESGLPSGRGLLLDDNNDYIYEGWFQYGLRHGYGRTISK